MYILLSVMHKGNIMLFVSDLFSFQTFIRAFFPIFNQKAHIELLTQVPEE